jgi:uncharacterized protein DUF5677
LLAPNFKTLVNEPSWGLLHTMYKRALAHVEGCFVLFSHNYCSSAEALCRTAVESSINLYYCSLGNTEERTISYFKQYILDERKQNRLWLDAVNASKYPAAAKAYHRERIAEKEEALRKYERFLTRACGQLSLDYEKMKVSWPRLLDRFQSIGKEVAYRTVYSSLCSQARNDAEDLLNEFVAGAVQVEGIWEQHQRENIGFALFMILISVNTLIEGAAIYLAKYSLGSSKTLMPLVEDVNRVIHRVVKRYKLETRAV